MPSAAAVMVQTGTSQFEFASVEKAFQFTPKDHHRIKLVRQPEGVTVFVDGTQVLSAAVGDRRESQEPNFHLVGTFGPKGSIVFYDNFAIRTPPGSLGERK